jgi:alcohol dehydrogenase (NADP+)
MVKAYAAPSATAPLAPFEITRREVGDHDVRIEIAWCGVCHSDIHQVQYRFVIDMKTL